MTDQVWLLDAHGVLRAGPPERIVADGHVNAAFDSQDLTFDRETVGFQLRATPTGTARLTILSAAGARVLTRLGWEVTTTGPTDLEVRATGTDFDVHAGGRTVSSAAGRLDTQDRRVAASILFQGLAARWWNAS